MKPFRLLVLAPGLAMLSLVGCHSDRMQQQRVEQDMTILHAAMEKGQPVPPLSSDPSRHGAYRPLMVHLHREASRLQGAVAAIKSLTVGEEDILRPNSLADAAIRQRNHERLGKLVQSLGEAIQGEDSLAGPGGDKAVEAMDFNEEFKRGVLKGLEGGRPQILRLISIFKLKQVYYRKVDAVLSHADANLVGLSPAGMLLFRTTEDAKAYSAMIQELVAHEQELNRLVLQLNAKEGATTSTLLPRGPQANGPLGTAPRP